MALTRASLLQTLLIAAAAAPLAAGCGGETTDDTGTTAGGAGGSSSGASGHGGGATAGASGGSSVGGASTAGTSSGTAGTTSAGAGGATTGGSAGTTSLGGGGTTTGGTGGAATGGAGGAATGGSAGTTGGSAGGASAGGTSAGTSSGGTSAGGSAGSTSGSGGGVSTGGAAGAAGAKVACDSPTPVLVGGQPTGFVTCANGAIVRPKAAKCPDLLQPKTTCGSPGSPAGACSTNADCKDAAYGRCSDTNGGFVCQCTYGCVQDSDCASDEICQCGDPVGQCVKAGCRTDADCTEGGCAQYEAGPPGCGTQAFACQTLADSCASNQGCQDNGGFGLCHIENPGDPRACAPVQCAIGRPLLVERRLRQAALATSAAWG